MAPSREEEDSLQFLGLPQRRFDVIRWNANKPRNLRPRFKNRSLGWGQISVVFFPKDAQLGSAKKGAYFVIWHPFGHECPLKLTLSSVGASAERPAVDNLMSACRPQRDNPAGEDCDPG